MDIHSNVQYLKGVGEKRAKMLNRLGIKTLDDLFHFYPKGYENWSKITSIRKAQEGELCCLKLKIVAPATVQHRGSGKLLVKALAGDSTGLITLIFFNNKYVANQLKEYREYLFFGKISYDRLGDRCMVSPKFCEAKASSEQLRPVYKQTQGLTSAVIERIVKYAFDDNKNIISETLPDYIINKYGFLTLADSLYQMHFPQSSELFFKAKNRLIFEELLCLQTGLGLMRTRGKKYTCVQIKEDFSREFQNLLPFEMTNAQRKCINECISDMKSGTPMNRLVQGDVGSGKTVVAASLVYTAVKNGWQCAFMVPTEILAHQHEKTVKKLFGDSIRVTVITGKTKQKKKVYEHILNGETDLVIGTHALIQDNVIFKNLGLVITDEQHRFGVKQRAKLNAKGRNPHTLVMSATPIPRTLGLIIYGELDVSVIDELPKGRQKIETYFVNTSFRERIYKFIRKNVNEGRQAYVICPLVEESESEESQLVSAEEYFLKLKNEVFPDLNVGLIHGKMDASQKDSVMEEFSKGNIDILVATVVIEVGIDVPNASVMVIENAERFGLSQLHQLRGRIGRGQYKSTCILLSDAQNDESVQRLKIICSSTDGFIIADEDLKLRGPGDFLGERQHGLPEMRIANITSDTKILFEAKNTAEMIIESDPDLSFKEHRMIKSEIDRMFALFGKTGLN